MKTFAIYEQSENNRVAVKVGFCWPAFFFSFWWCLAARLWERAGIAFGCSVVVLIIEMAAESVVIGFIGLMIIGAIVGWNGNKWRRTNLRARGFNLVAVVESGSKDGALVKLREMSPDELYAAKEQAVARIAKIERERRGED